VTEFTSFGIPVRDPSDLLAIKRGDLLELAQAAMRASAYTRVGQEGVATGICTFLNDELLTLAGQPPMCSQCVSDAEAPGLLCAYHADLPVEQAAI
jgi:hypothetical protein